MDLDALIEQKSQTEIGKKLANMLKNIWDNKDFILGCLVDLDNDEKKQIMIDAIETNFEYYEFEDDLTEYADKIVTLAFVIERGDILVSPTQKIIVPSLERYIPTLEII